MFTFKDTSATIWLFILLFISNGNITFGVFNLLYKSAIKVSTFYNSTSYETVTKYLWQLEKNILIKFRWRKEFPMTKDTCGYQLQKILDPRIKK